MVNDIRTNTVNQRDIFLQVKDLIGYKKLDGFIEHVAFTILMLIDSVMPLLKGRRLLC